MIKHSTYLSTHSKISAQIYVYAEFSNKLIGVQSAENIRADIISCSYVNSELLVQNDIIVSNLSPSSQVIFSESN